MRIISLLLTLIVFAGCGSSNEDKPLSSVSGDTLIVTGDAAVYYQQDSLFIDAERKKNEADFTLGLEDYHMYLDSTHRFLDSVKSKVATLDAKDRKFIKFVRSDNTATVITVGSLQTLWGLYLFTPSKQPEEADMTDIRTSYRNYFK